MLYDPYGNQVKSDKPINESIVKLQQEVDKNTSDQKAYILDPTMLLGSQYGYRTNFAQRVTYDNLRYLSESLLIAPLINKILSLIKKFAVPQNDKYSIGYTVEKVGYDSKMSKEDERIKYQILEDIEYCGNPEYSMVGDTFIDFIQQNAMDSFVYNFAPFEIVWNQLGWQNYDFTSDKPSKAKPVYFKSFPAYSTRLAATNDPYDNDITQPFLTQLWYGTPKNVFYRPEAGVIIRNKTLDPYYNGYGKVELDTLQRIIMSYDNAIKHNDNHFSNGALTNGLLKLKSANVNSFNQIKHQIKMQAGGVNNSNGLLVLQGDDFDYMDTRINNLDMQFMEWVHFIIKVACSLYQVNPTIIGFADIAQAAGLGAGTGIEPLLEMAKECVLNYLIPLQTQLTLKYVQPKYGKEWKFKFVGGAMSREQELEAAIKESKSIFTLNETREKQGLPKIEGLDFPADATVLKMYEMYMQGKQAESKPQEQPKEPTVNENTKAIDKEADNEKPIRKAYLQNSLDRFFND